MDCVYSFLLLQNDLYASIQNSTFDKNQLDTDLFASAELAIDGSLEVVCPNLPKLQQGLGGTMFINDVERLEIKKSEIRNSIAL